SFDISTIGNPTLKAEIRNNLEGKIEMDMEIKAKLDFMFYYSAKNNVPTTIAFGFPYRADVKTSFAAEAAVILKQPDKPITLTKKVKVFDLWFPVAGVPIYMRVDMDSVLDYAISLNGKIKAEKEGTIISGIGFYYENGKYDSIPFDELPEFEGEIVPGAEPLNGTAEISIGPRVRLSFYRYMELISAKFMMGLKATVSPADRDPFCLDLTSQFKADVDMLKAFKKVLPSGNAVKAEWTLWELDPPIRLFPTEDEEDDEDTEDTDTSWYNPDRTEFEISNARQLAGLAKLVNETQSGALRDDFYGKTITLTQNINLAGREWTPIGSNFTTDSHFRGTFDGGKHTISNMLVDIKSSTGSVFAGLFGENDGTIKNVILNDFSVSADSSFSSVISFSGGLAARNRTGTITDCTVSVSVSSAADYSISFAGGLVGWNHEGTITNCTANGRDIRATSKGGEDDEVYSGGLIGYFYRGTLSGNRAAMSPAIGFDYRHYAPSNNI
ncbi:MAG: hypothetical protein LBO21_02785, partial [Synergistaceae bacterium]|nr:hypothetical protein [Synergistaceae bacterium]